jgi:hypothetical protein
VKEAGVDKLLTPGYFFFAINTLEKLLEGLSLFLGFSIRYNFDDASVLFRDFNSFWCSIVKLQTKNFISFGANFFASYFVFSFAL